MSRTLIWLLGGGAVLIGGGAYVLHAHAAAVASQAAAQTASDQTGGNGQPPLFLPSGSSGAGLDGVSSGLGSGPVGTSSTNPASAGGTVPATDPLALISGILAAATHSTDATTGAAVQGGNLQAIVAALASGANNVTGTVGNTAGGTTIDFHNTPPAPHPDLAQQYLADNPDVARAYAAQQAGIRTMYPGADLKTFVLDHYYQFGQQEGRVSPLTGLLPDGTAPTPGHGMPAA